MRPFDAPPSLPGKAPLAEPPPLEVLPPEAPLTVVFPPEAPLTAVLPIGAP